MIFWVVGYGLFFLFQHFYMFFKSPTVNIYYFYNQENVIFKKWGGGLYQYGKRLAIQLLSKRERIQEHAQAYRGLEETDVVV